MNWQSLVLWNALLVGVSIILMRRLAREPQNAQASFAVNALLYVGLYLSGLVFLPWLGHVRLAAFTDYYWRLIGGGLAFMCTNVATYKMLTYIDAAMGSILNTLNTLCTVILAALVLNEDLSPRQAIGGAVLLLAIIYGLLAFRAHQSKINRRHLWLALLYALLAGITYSVAIVNEKSLLGHMTAASYVVFGWGGQFAASLAAALVIQPTSFKLLRGASTLSMIILIGALRGVGGICFVLAQIRSNNVALVTVISSTRLLVVIVLGAIVLKERQKLLQKFISATSAIAGLGIMFWK